MSLTRVRRRLFRLALRLVPRPLHTRRMAAGFRVLRLSPEQRAVLARNLRACGV